MWPLWGERVVAPPVAAEEGVGWALWALTYVGVALVFVIFASPFNSRRFNAKSKRLGWWNDSLFVRADTYAINCRAFATSSMS